MAFKLPDLLAPGVSHAKPASKTSRPSTGALLPTVTDTTVILKLGIGLEVSAAEADLYLHWASDLLTRARDDDADGSC